MTFWLSFATDAGSLGVVIVPDVTDLAAALTKTSAAGLNPGGEVAGFGWDPNAAPGYVTREMSQYPVMTLLTPEFLESRGAVKGTPYGPIDVVCEDCNRPDKS